MKLMIYYDLESAIKNVNEPLTPFKVIRGEKKRLTYFIPIWTTLNGLLYDSIFEAIGTTSLSMAFYIATFFCLNIQCGDVYYENSSQKLKKLSSQLKDLYIYTDYDLLLDSKVYEKKHKIELNEKKIPIIAEEKYILVPTYNYHGEIKDTSILQEHIVGSKEYVLSLGSPKKEFKLAYTNT